MENQNQKWHQPKIESRRNYSESGSYEGFDLGEDRESPAAVTTTEVDDTAYHATYTIPRQCSILTDGKERKVTVAEIPFPMEFVYVVSPNVAIDVFLKGNTVNKSKYILLKGVMNVFMDNFFITQTQLKDTARNEKIEVYLGSDSSVKMKIFPDTSNKGEKSGFLTAKKTRQSTIHVTEITNNKNIPINVLVLDQLPRATDEKIIVTIIKQTLEEAVTIDDNNIIQWFFELGERSSVTIEFGFEIEFPKANYVLIDKIYQ